MLGGGSKLGVKDELPVSIGGEENDMGYNSELENPENHQTKRPSDDEKTDTKFEDVNNAGSGSKVEDIQVDQIYKDSEDFRKAIKDYAIYKGFEFKTVKSPKYRVTL